MFLISLVAFAAVLLVLAVAAVRDFNHIDEFLELVEPGDSGAPRPEGRPTP